MRQIEIYDKIIDEAIRCRRESGKSIEWIADKAKVTSQTVRNFESKKSKNSNVLLTYIIMFGIDVEKFI